MERGTVTMGSVLLIFILYTDVFHVAESLNTDAGVIGDKVWGCTVETFDKVINSPFSSNVQCRYESLYEQCLANNLTTRTMPMRQYNRELLTTPCRSANNYQIAANCIRGHARNINTKGCLRNIQNKMATASSPLLTQAEQKVYYCEAILLTANCYGLHVISNCGLEGMELYGAYFTLPKIEGTCLTKLNRSPDQTNVNIGGNTGDIGNFNIDDFFTDFPPFDIPTGFLGLNATNSTPGSNVVAGPGGGTTAVTASWSDTDAHAIGLSVWTCVTTTFNRTLHRPFGHDIQCWYRSRFESCLQENLTAETKVIKDYNKELDNQCSTTIQRVPSGETCVKNQWNRVNNFGCLSNIFSKMNTFQSSRLSTEELKKSFCEAILETSDCIGKNVIMNCALDGMELYGNYITLTRTLAACQKALGRSPDETVINVGGNTQTGNVPSDFDDIFNNFFGTTTKPTSVTHKVQAVNADAMVIGDKVWGCTLETFDKIINTPFTSNVQCRYESLYEQCLGSNLTTRTMAMKQYNKDLLTTPCRSANNYQTAANCIKGYAGNINQWGCHRKIKDKMATASSSSLSGAEQQMFYCEAILLTANCYGLNVISYCGLEGMEVYGAYFTLSKVEKTCLTKLNRSSDHHDVNIGGNSGNIGDFNIDDFFTDFPSFNIPTATIPVPSHTVQSHSNLPISRETTTQSTSTSRDADNIGRTVWTCVIQVFTDTLQTQFSSDIQCRYRSNFDSCLDDKLTSETHSMREYNKELNNQCTGTVQRVSAGETCVKNQWNKINTFGCLNNILSKMRTFQSTRLSEEEQKRSFCEAILETSDCIGENVIMNCALDGMELYGNYITLTRTLAACQKALGRSPDETVINVGGNTQTGNVPSDFDDIFNNFFGTTTKPTTTIPPSVPVQSITTQFESKPPPSHFTTTQSTSTSSSDAVNIGRTVWTCANQVFKGIMQATFTSDIQCRYHVGYDSCLKYGLSTATSGMRGYNKQLHGHCNQSIHRVSTSTENCVKTSLRYFNGQQCLTNIIAKMNTATSTTLSVSQQKIFYCEAVLMAEDCIGKNVIMNCDLDALSLYSTYLTFAKINVACQAALGRSPDDVSVNIGGQQGGTDVNIDDIFNQFFGTTTKGVPSSPVHSVSTTKALSLDVSTIAVTNGHSDAEKIGETVWTCTSQTFRGVLQMDFSTDIQCRYRSGYDHCLGGKLTRQTMKMREYNLNLDSQCDQAVQQVDTTTENCVYLGTYNLNKCKDTIRSKMVTAKSPSLSQTEQRKFYCEAVILASQCIGKNVIMNCDLEGMELYANYMTLSKTTKACYSALGRSPDSEVINIGGSTIDVTATPRTAGTSTSTQSSRTTIRPNFVFGPGGHASTTVLHYTLIPAICIIQLIFMRL